MRDYAKVTPAFWIGRTGKMFRGDAETQLLALYLMTSPHSNMIGVYHCPILYMAHETGMAVKGASKALQRLIEAGFCTYDEASELVFVHRMAAFQIAELLKPGDNRIKGVIKDWENIPVSRMKRAFHAIYADAFHLPDWLDSGPENEAPCKPLGSQEQEQEQEQDTPIPPKRGVSDELFDQFWSAYPKKVGKGAAKKRFKSLKPDDELVQQMLSALDWQSETEQWRRDGGRYIPNPGTWLNQERWLDGESAAAGNGVGVAFT